MFKRSTALVLAALAAAFCTLAPAASAYDDDEDAAIGSVFGDFSAPYMLEEGFASKTEFLTREDFAQNRVTVVNLWDSSCLFCRLELAELQQISVDYSECGVRVVGAVTTVMGGSYPAAWGYLQEFGVTYDNVIPDDEMESILFIYGGTPQTFFVDPEGRVLDHIRGSAEYAEFASRLNALLMLKGDADCSGTLSFSDISMVYGYIIAGSSLTPLGLLNADMDDNGDIGFTDVSQMYITLVG